MNWTDITEDPTNYDRFLIFSDYLEENNGDPYAIEGLRYCGRERKSPKLDECMNAWQWDYGLMGDYSHDIDFDLFCYLNLFECSYPKSYTSFCSAIWAIGRALSRMNRMKSTKEEKSDGNRTKGEIFQKI